MSTSEALLLTPEQRQSIVTLLDEIRKELLLNEDSHTLRIVTSQIELDLFTDYESEEKSHQKTQERLNKERRIQEVQLKIKQRFGKNAILRGLNFEEGATARERNNQIGGHKA